MPVPNLFRNSQRFGPGSVQKCQLEFNVLSHFCNICHYDKLKTCQGVSHLHPRASAYLKRIVPWGHRPAETASTEPNFYTGLKFGCKC